MRDFVIMTYNQYLQLIYGTKTRFNVENGNRLVKVSKSGEIEDVE